MQANQELDSDLDGENLVSEWSTDNIVKVDEQLIIELEVLRTTVDLCCDKNKYV